MKPAAAIPLLALAWAVAPTAFAGTYSNAFTFANGTTALGGGTTLTSAGGNAVADGFAVGCVVNNTLRLADRNSGSRNTGFVVPSLDGSAPIASFTVKFDLNFNRIGTDTPADGFGFTCGQALSGTSSETGFPAAGGLTVGWDTYTNGPTDPIGIDVIVDGVGLQTVTAQSLYGGAAPFFPYDTAFRRVMIHWDEAGLDVIILNNEANPSDDIVVIENMEVPGFAPTGGESFGFGARTGGAKQDVFIDNLLIETTLSTLVANPETGGPVISEFMAGNTGTYEDEDRDTPDWIEIYNGQNAAANLAGWKLAYASNGVNLAEWTFPSVNVPAYGYLLVFASGKNRTTFQNVHLHTSFTLPREGGAVRLIRPNASLASDLAYTNQADDISFGFLDFTQAAGYLETPSVLARNRGLIAPGPPLPDVVFSIPSLVCTNATNLVVSIPTNAPPGTVIRHTTSGGVPSVNSALLTAPVSVTGPLWLRARLFHPNFLPSRTGNRTFVFLDTSTDATRNLVTNYNNAGQPFRSNLPVVVLDSFGRNIDALTNPSGYRPYRFTQAAIYDVNTATGLATLGTSPTNLHRAATHVRGQSSSGFGQKPYALEFWQERSDTDRDVEILGFPSESDFVLHSPAIDKTLMRNRLAYDTMIEACGDGYAMRSRYVEVFFNQDGGAVGYQDYRGVYLLVERIKRTPNRLDLEKINPAMSDPALISGGYIFKIDKTPYQAPIITAGSGTPWGARTWDVEDPEPASTVQLNWLKKYLDDTDKALMQATFANPASTNYYGNWLDADSFINRFWFQELYKEVDGFIFSYYLSKDRGQPMRALPMWDLDRSLGNANYGEADTEAGFLSSRSNYPHYPRLQADPNYVQRQWDRWWELRRGALSTDSLFARIEATAALLTNGASAAGVTNTSAPTQQNPAARHFKRWAYLGANTYGNAHPGQIDRVNYRHELDMIKVWLQRRLEWIDGTAPARPPRFVNPGTQADLAGGPVALGTAVGMRNESNAGAVLYTVNGPDPRQPGGTTAPAAVTATGAGVSIVTTLVNNSQPWRWLAPAAAPDNAWHTPGFNDSGWTTSSAPIGYGETLTTTIPQPAQTGSDAPPPVYFRRTFTATNPAQFNLVYLELMADDGAVVYINGQEAARLGMPINLPVGYGTRFPTAVGGVYPLAAGPHDTGVFETNYQHVRVNPALLVNGTNTIAVSVHQAFYGNTSATDMRFDCRVRAVTTASATATLTLSTPGAHTIRARTLNAGTWSALREETYVVGTVPAASTNLVVSEIHYHPADPSPAEVLAGFNNDNEFEFVELMNVGPGAINLTGVILTNGVSFSFADATPESMFLAPGGRLVVVENAAGFAARATNGTPVVAGQYTGSLSNAGETIEVRNSVGGLITSVTYDDAAPWPVTTDGLGPSLVYNHPFARPDPNLPSSWRPSFTVHGNPGASDSAPYPASPQGDDDNDGVVNLVEYALPPGHTVTAEILPYAPPLGATADHLFVSIRRNLNADGFLLVPERSPNLTAWDAAAFTYLGVTANGDGTATLLWRSNTPASPVRDYVRVRVQP